MPVTFVANARAADPPRYLRVICHASKFIIVAPWPVAQRLRSTSLFLPRCPDNVLCDSDLSRLVNSSLPRPRR